MQKRKLGNFYERCAKHYLQRRLWRLVCANFQCQGGEIDLIMQNFNKTHLIFVEVRYRNNANYGGSISSVDTYKQRKIIHAAQQFLMCHPNYNNYILRFDVICFDKNKKIDWIQDAFRVQ